MSTLFSHFFEKINQIAPQEADFTEVLSSIAVKPKTLYFYGKLPQNMVKNGKQMHSKTVAIVGSRHNTKYGEEIAYKLAYELGKKGVVVISGLAYGIDSIGHRGCLDAGGTTVAVLGTPIDQIYPKEHRGLAKEIIETGGAIISEYAPGAEVFPKTSFLERNRIISGLSDIVVVVEAAEKSGSLNTATHALAQGKTIFAVPGNVTSPYSQGCNKLIRQGAIPYSEPDDILRELFPEDYTKKYRKLKKSHLIGDTDAETAILKALAAGARSGDDIMKVSLLPAEVFNQTVTMLELKSRVRALGMNNWSLM
ncbi:DNA-processing protein DprA [Candidatus Saccharibacteria bacterium]|nr:DNA-processing protein DprA [Candidatus Saccharibacteria bacterium]